MMKLYTIVYQTGLLTEYYEKWDDKPRGDKRWANFQTQFMDAQCQMNYLQKQTLKQRWFHGANLLLT